MGTIPPGTSRAPGQGEHPERGEVDLHAVLHPMNSVITAASCIPARNDEGTVGPARAEQPDRRAEAQDQRARPGVSLHSR